MRSPQSHRHHRSRRLQTRATAARGSHRQTRPRGGRRRGKREEPLRVLQWNVRGLRTRKVELARLMEEEKVDVVLLQETMATPGRELPNFPGYTIQRADRRVHRTQGADPANRHQGGLAVLIRRGINFEPLPPPPFPADCPLEWLGIRIHLPTASTLDLWNYYRPPVRDGTSDGRSNNLHMICWPSKGDRLLAGDLNLHGTWSPNKPTCAAAMEVEAWAGTTGTVWLNDGTATRFSDTEANPSAPDVTFCSPSLSLGANWRVLEEAGSDHRPILITLQRRVTRPPRQKAQFRLHKADWAAYRQVVDEELADLQLETMSLEAASKAFIAVLHKALHLTCPKGHRRRTKVWWSLRCQKAKEERQAAAQRATGVRTSAAAAELQQARARFQQVVKEEKLRSWELFTSTLDPTAPIKQRKVWSVMRALDGRARAPMPDQPIRLDRPSYLHPRLAISDRQKANTAALHFRKVSSLKIPRSFSLQCKQQIRDHIKSDHMPAAATPFSADELRAALFPKGKKGKAAGPDGLLPIQLKELSDFGRSVLLGLLNKAWRMARVPSSWKQAWVVPILKKGKDPQQIASYRPVSLLSVLARTMETMMRIRMNYWAETSGLIPQEQSGFRAGRSTTDAIITTAQRAFDDLNTPLSRRVGVAATYPQRSYLLLLDIKGAYDRIYRDGLLAKMADMGIPSH